MTTRPFRAITSISTSTLPALKREPVSAARAGDREVLSFRPAGTEVGLIVGSGDVVAFSIEARVASSVKRGCPGRRCALSG